VWRAEDITPLGDPVAWVRSHPDMCLGKGYKASNELLLRRLRDTLWVLRPAAEVRTEVHIRWGVLTCDVDWLDGDERDAFRELVPHPEAGQNNSRAEVLITAFSSFAATTTSRPDEIDLLVGEFDQQDHEVLDYAKAQLRTSGRAVVFRV